jgi:hypothetical protein
MSRFLRLALGSTNARHGYRDLEIAEQVLATSGLDWQAVRPVTLTDAPMSGHARVTEHYRLTMAISRADVAGFMLRELEADAFSARTPQITA